MHISNNLYHIKQIYQDHTYKDFLGLTNIIVLRLSNLFLEKEGHKMHQDWLFFNIRCILADAKTQFKNKWMLVLGVSNIFLNEIND